MRRAALGFLPEPRQHVGIQADRDEVRGTVTERWPTDATRAAVLAIW